MSDPNVSLQTVSYLIAALSFAVTCAYYIMNLNNNKKNQELTLKAQQQNLETRQAQLFMQIYSSFHDKETPKTLGKFLQQDKYKEFDFFNYNEEQGELYAEFYSLANYFEGIGVLVKRKLVDPSIVVELMSGASMRIWEQYGPNIIKSRQKYNYPQLYEYIEYLYDTIKPLVEAKHPEFKV